MAVLCRERPHSPESSDSSELSHELTSSTQVPGENTNFVSRMVELISKKIYYHDCEVWRWD